MAMLLNENNFVISHPRTSKYGNNAYWLAYDSNPRCNPSKNGITLSELKKALTQFIPDNSQYLGGIEEIQIWDRGNEEFWLKRCLTSDENINDWKIIYIAGELLEDGSPHGWIKQVLYNTKTDKYSLRSSSKWNNEDDYFKISSVKSRAKDNDWFVEWSKLLADKQFWINLKNRFENDSK